MFFEFLSLPSLTPACHLTPGDLLAHSSCPTDMERSYWLPGAKLDMHHPTVLCCSHWNSSQRYLKEPGCNSEIHICIPGPAQSYPGTQPLYNNSHLCLYSWSIWSSNGCGTNTHELLLCSKQSTRRKGRHYSLMQIPDAHYLYCDFRYVCHVLCLVP